MVFWAWSEVFDALAFRIALVRVGRGASPASAKASAGMERGDGSKRNADPSLPAEVRMGVGGWIAATHTSFESADSVGRRNDSSPTARDCSERRDQRDGFLGRASVFHALVFRIALVGVGRRAWSVGLP